MRAFNKKGKPKHSTKIKYVKVSDTEYVLTQRCSINRSFYCKGKRLFDYMLRKYDKIKKVYSWGIEIRKYK